METARFGAGGRPAATAIGRPKSTAAAAAPGSPAAPAAAAAAAAAAVPDVPGSVRVAHPWADMVCAPSLRTTGEISVLGVCSALRKLATDAPVYCHILSPIMF